MANKLKYVVQNDSNNTVLDGKLILPIGSSSAPSLTFTSNEDTGIFENVYSGTSRQLNIVVDGSTKASFNSAGITSHGNVYSAAAGQFRNYSGVWKGTTGVSGNGFEFVSADGTAMTLSSTGNMIVKGNTTSEGYLQSYGILYLRNNIQLLNKAGDGWLTFATRDTSGSEAVYNLDHIGTIDIGNGEIDLADANNYARITVAGGSAQLGLFRSGSSVGGGYIGADVNKFRVYQDNFAERFAVELDGTGAQFSTTNVTAGGNTMWHAGNDGTTSGLDADMVDGVHASQFFRRDANLGYFSHTGSGTYFQNNTSYYPSPAMMLVSAGMNLANNGLVFDVARHKTVESYKLDSGVWQECSSSTDFNNLLGGDFAHQYSNLDLINGTNDYIIYFGNQTGYTFLEWLVMTTETRGNSFIYKFETTETAHSSVADKTQNVGSGGWSVKFTSSAHSSWPGYIVDRIYEQVGGGADDYLRIRITPTWASGNTNNIRIGALGLITSYGSAFKPINTNRAMEIIFADNIKISSGKKLFLDGGGNTYIHEVAGDDIDIVAGGNNSIQVRGANTNLIGDVTMLSGTSGTTNKIIFKRTDNSSVASYIRTNAYWNEYGSHQNEGHKFIDNNNNILLQLNGGNSSTGNGALSATFAGNIYANADIVFGGNDTYNATINYIDNGSGDHYLVFQTKHNGTTDDTLKLHAQTKLATFSGDVTIDNTSSGDAILTLATTTGGDPMIVMNSDAANRSGLIRYQDNGTNIGRIEYVHNGDKLQFQAGSATGQILELTNSGATFAGNVKITGTQEKVLELDTSSDTGAIHFEDNGTIRGILGFSNGSTITQSASDHDMVLRSEAALLLTTNTGNVALTLDTSQNATFAGDITGAENFKATGNNMKLFAGGTHVINIDLNKNFYPQTHNDTDIGFSDTLAFRHAYFSGTGKFSNVNASSYQLNGTYIVDSSRNLVNINDITASQLTIDDYIYHAGDSNTYIYFTDDKQTFRTGGDDRFIIDNNGSTFSGHVKLFNTDEQIPNQNLLDIGSIKIAGRNDIYANATKTTYGDYVAKYVNDGTGGSTIRLYVDTNVLVDGDTYMVSVYYENLIGNLTLDWGDTGITGTNDVTGTSSSPKSGRLFGYASRATYGSTYRFLDINLSNGSGNEVTLHSPKVEAGRVVTDFVATERTDMTSNSKHLKDLKVTHSATFEQGVDINYGGSDRLSITGDVNVQGSTDLTIPQTRKLRFDGAGGHTYIAEESDSNLKVYVAATEVVNFTNDFTQFNDPIKPTGNGTHDLGGSSNRWATVYASNINTNTSSTFGHDIVLDDHVDHSPNLYFYNQANNYARVFFSSTNDLNFKIGTSNVLSIDGSSTVIEGNLYLNNVDTNTSSETTVLVINGSTNEVEKRDLGSLAFSGLSDSASGNRWGVNAFVASDGVMEVGKYIDFHNSDGDTSDYALRITANGSTAQFSAGLTCTSFSSGGTNNLNGITRFNYTANSVGSQFESPTSALHTFRCDSDKFRIWMGGTGGSSETFTVLETGRIGINDGTPDYTLDVSGNVSNISIYASHDIAAYSDARVKDEIETIPNALDKVNKLRGVTFKRTDEGSTDKRMMGVIAQEVLDIIPEVVNKRESDGHYSVSYGNMVGVLIEAVKELKAEVEELKKQIK